MKEVVEYIVSQIVSHKEDVKVIEEELEEGVVTLRVLVHDDDMGKVIGKNGRIASAIRSIVKSASNKMSKKYFVKIGEREA